jgi:hypothetical protein
MAAKTLAASSGRREYEIIEDARSPDRLASRDPGRLA